MNINELDLGNDNLGLNYNEIPEETSEYTPPLQPGSYVFSLPSNLNSIWEVIERSGQKRVQAVFHNTDALTVHLPNNETRSFSAWISNHPFPRGKEKIEVSDMQYLLRILEPAATPQTNTEFVDLLKKHGGDRFKANVTWSAFCNPNKDAYFETAPDEAGNTSVVVQEGTKGCGENYYQKAIPRDDAGMFADTFKCTECNAVVRAFPKLRKFSSIEA